jgi:cytochrome c553
MTQERNASFRNTWFAASVGITVAVAVAGALVGFVWLPLLQQQGAPFQSVWDAICGAAGLVHLSPTGDPIVQADHPTTSVAVTPQMLRSADAVSIGHGATLALRCTMCHGAVGLSLANAPNLAGQYRVAIYKQLVDFKTGARESAVMGPLVRDLSDPDLRDLAAYYAYLPRISDRDAAPDNPPRIVESGDPMRGIAPCGACHGTVDSKAGAAWLGGQPAAYLHAELVAFASGARRNDIGEQMRNVARRMTPEEIDAASRYYAEHP